MIRFELKAGLRPVVPLGVVQGTPEDVLLQEAELAVGQVGSLFQGGQEQRLQFGMYGFNLSRHPMGIAHRS